MKRVLLSFTIGSMALLSGQQTDSLQTLQEVTIATKSPTTLEKTNVYVISQEDLQKTKGFQLSELLQTVAGFNINGANTNSTEPKSYNIRGGKNRNVLILIEGVPIREVTGNDYNSYDLRNIAIENIQSIEVINGANSVLYGSNATVSVIDIKTKPKIPQNIQGTTTLSYGSQNTFAQHLSVSGAASKLFYSIYANNAKSEGISSAKEISSQDTFDRDGYEKQNILSQIGYKYSDKGSFSIDWGWNHLLFDYDAYAFTDARNRGENNSNFIGGNVTQKHKLGTLNFHTLYSTSDVAFSDWENIKYIPNFNSKGYNFFAEIYNVLTIHENIKLTSGIQYDNQAMDYYTDVFQPDFSTLYTQLLKKSDTEMNQFDLYTEANANWKNLYVNAGVRYTNHADYGSHFTYAANPFFLIPLKNDTKIKLGVSLATAFVTPSLYQLYGDNIYTAANRNLEPEETMAYEFNTAYYNQNFTVAANLYYRDEDNFFKYQTNPTTRLSQYINTENSFVKGFEILAMFNWKDKVTVKSNFSYTERDSETGMLRIPHQRWNNTIQFLLLRNTSLSIIHQFTSKKEDIYFDDSTFTNVYLENEAYHLFHIFIQHKIIKQLEISGAIKNIFNTAYTDNIGYNEMPRFVEIAIRYTL